MTNMRKFLLTAVLVLTSLGGVYAQDLSENTDKYKVETNRFWDNWFISAGGGVQVYFGDADSKASFSDRLAPALDISLGKWFTPGLGLRLSYNGLQAKGASVQDIAFSTGKTFNKDGATYYKTKWNMMNLHSDVMFNLSNMLVGYNPNRVYSFIPYVGFGWAHSYDRPRNNEITFNAGLINKFRLSPALDLNVEFRGFIVKDGFDGEIGGKSYEGLGAATLGLTYKFKQRDFKRGTVVTTGISEDEMRRIQNQLRESQAYNDQLKAELDAARKKKNVVVEKEIVDAAPRVVFFQIGSSQVSKQDRVHLRYMADAIKAGDSNKVYTIRGYADKQTGSSSWNEKLSRMRAEAVRDVLVDEFGVSSSQIQIDAKGGVDTMYYDAPNLSRVVIME